jgi:hypothetical protein
MLGDIKAVIAAAAVAVFIASGWYSCARVGSVRLEKAQAEIAALQAQVEVCTQVDKQKDGTIAQLRALNDEQSIAIANLQKAGADLEAARQATEARLAVERKAKEEALAKLGQPLPETCEAKVREIVRRIQAAL